MKYLICVESDLGYTMLFQELNYSVATRLINTTLIPFGKCNKWTVTVSSANIIYNTR